MTYLGRIALVKGKHLLLSSELLTCMYILNW